MVRDDDEEGCRLPNFGLLLVCVGGRDRESEGGQSSRRSRHESSSSGRDQFI